MVWTDDLSVGVSLIDSQHKSLINAVNDLFDACGKGKGRSKISETLKFMQGYVATHFSDEERLQLKCGYPDYSKHKLLHKSFVEKVREYSDKLEKNGPNIALVAEFNVFVSNWLVNHISREDKKIGQFINSQKAGV